MASQPEGDEGGSAPEVELINRPQPPSGAANGAGGDTTWGGESSDEDDNHRRVRVASRPPPLLCMSACVIPVRASRRAIC